MAKDRSAAYAALVLRLGLGALFVVHLYWKYAVRGFQPWYQGFIDAGYPKIVMAYVVCAESAAAVLLIAGIWTRWVSLLSVPLMLGAAHYWLVRKGFFFTVAGAEFPLLWGFALVIQAMLGDGAYAARLPWQKRRAS